MTKRLPITIVIKAGMVQSVHTPGSLERVPVVVLDLDRVCDEDDLPDPELAVRIYTEDRGLVERTTIEAQQPVFHNKYRHCGTTWTDTWSCACDSECPKCGADVQAHDYTITDSVTEAA